MAQSFKNNQLPQVLLINLNLKKFFKNILDKEVIYDIMITVMGYSFNFINQH